MASRRHLPTAAARTLVGALFLASAAAGGCQHRTTTEPGRAAGPTRVTVGSGGGRAAAPADPGTPQPPAASDQLAPHPDELGGTDPCRNRLDELRFQLLLYYATHHRLPGKLDDLKAQADPGDNVEYTCPASGKPYVYVPAGLRGPGRGKEKDRRLILYDPTPAHAGVRRAITMNEPLGNQPAALWVDNLTDKALRGYTENPSNLSDEAAAPPADAPAAPAAPAGGPVPDAPVPAAPK